MADLCILDWEQVMAAEIEIARVSLAVRDLARVAAFYQDVIGLAVTASGPGSMDLGVAGDGFLHLLHRPDAIPDDVAQAGLYHTAVLLPSRADLGGWFAHARKAGVSLVGSADHLVSEAFYLSDPEGNGVEMYSDRPRSEWRWTVGAEGRRVQMANQPIDRAGLLRQAAPWHGAPAGTRIGHVHLRVGDVAAARRFYGGVLGLDLMAGWPGAAFLSSGGYHHHLGANSWHSAGAGLRDPARAGLVELVLAADEVTRSGIAARSQGLDLATGLRDPWGTPVTLTPIKTELTA